MTRYFVDRILLTTLPTLLVIAAFSFAITRAFLPDDFKSLIIDEYGRKDRNLAARIDSEVGLNGRTPIRFAQWLGVTWPWDGKTGILEGDFGTSLVSRRPVTSEVFERLPATIEVAALAQLMALGIALPLGLVASLRRDKWPDRLIGAIARFGVFPSVILAIQFITFGGLWWDPPIRFDPLWRDPLQNLQLLLPPACFMSLMPAGIFIRLARHQMIEVLDDPSPGTNIPWRYRVRALKDTHVRAALVPIVLGSGMSLQLLIGAAILYEQIFIVPGIGLLTVHALAYIDYPVLCGLILILAAVLVLITRLAELVCAFLMSKPIHSGAHRPDVRLWTHMYGASQERR